MKDEIKGKVDEMKGKVTGDRSEEMKGKAEQAGDKIRRQVRDVKADLTNESDYERSRRERDENATP